MVLPTLMRQEGEQTVPDQLCSPVPNPSAPDGMQQSSALPVVFIDTLLAHTSLPVLKMQAPRFTFFSGGEKNSRNLPRYSEAEKDEDEMFVKS